ncbi:glycosyltransferase [Falsiroseomonas sp. CW058]|uniref:glycosyltransferase n=1 Tax=Falsiroseomonas sp. CW058 TaxID=3388664 RepID=UPI003D310296
MTAPIIIYTRFSLINKNFHPGSWRIGRDQNFDDYVKSIIGDEGRLRDRCNIFELSAQNINAASEIEQIRHLVYASDALPSWVKNRLNTWSETYKWMTIRYLSFEEDASVNRDLIRAIASLCKDLRLSGRINYASVRLDDDDILSPKYFQHLSKYTSENFSGYCISFSSGYCAIWNGAEAVLQKFHHTRLPFNAQGLAYVGNYDIERGSVSSAHVLPPGTHTTVDLRAPTIVDGREPLYVRSVHPNSDTLFGLPDDKKRQALERIVGTGTPATREEIERTFVGLCV